MGRTELILRVQQRLQAHEDELENWENKRVPRLPGQAEWGELPNSNRDS
jgi:hypothetical protein